MTSEMFRANVGIAIIKAGEIAVFERIDKNDAWQLPQGGIDVGEKPVDAAFRELYEETGLNHESVKLVGEYPEWLAYELPDELKTGKYLGQVQRWFIFELLASDDYIDLDAFGHPEFSQFKWIDVSKLEEIPVEFRKSIYRQIAKFIQTL